MRNVVGLILMLCIVLPRIAVGQEIYVRPAVQGEDCGSPLLWTCITDPAALPPTNFFPVSVVYVDAAGAETDMTDQVRWSVSAPEVLLTTQPGVFLIVEPGTYWVRAHLGDLHSRRFVFRLFDTIESVELSGPTEAPPTSDELFVRMVELIEHLRSIGVPVEWLDSATNDLRIGSERDTFNLLGRNWLESSQNALFTGDMVSLNGTRLLIATGPAIVLSDQVAQDFVSAPICNSRGSLSAAAQTYCTNWFTQKCMP